MTDEQIQQAPEAAAPRKPWKRRLALRLLTVGVAILAGLLVTFFSVDLGPGLRALAEREGSKYIQRPMHIGKLSAKLTPGEFVVEDLLIEGLTPESRPFLKAKKIFVKFPWWSVFSRRITIEAVEMTDWDMFVERLPNGRHNFPKFTRERKSQGPKRFTTTVKTVNTSRGQFTYVDHGTPWSTIARNLIVNVHRGPENYLGTATFSDGTVKIQSYEPFRSDLRSRFTINGSKLHFDRMDLATDGARSVMQGDLDFSRFPEQTYTVRSEIDFPTQKNIFFHRDRFTVVGKGTFQGTWRLFQRGGFELTGKFKSPLTGVNEWRFPDLAGSVRWVPDLLEVTDATSGLYGGAAKFDYRMELGSRRQRPRVVWDVEYRDVSLPVLTDFLETEGIRLAGTISGRNHLEWPRGSGGWARKEGHGEVFAAPPPGVATLGRELTPAQVAAEAELPPESGPFNPHAPIGYVPIAGHVVYKLEPEWIVLGRSSVATPKTYVEFSGQTAFGQRSRIPFHVTSLDWQESDRVLAGIMTAFGSPTGAVPVGGHGEFDGVMLNAFNRPRIEGTFRGDRMRAWDVVWGKGTAKVAIENGYVDVTDAVITEGSSEIAANGRFSLGYPRRDEGEELNARVRIVRRPLADLRHAFALDDYPVEGLVSGEYHLYGHYETPHGFGRLTIDSGVAYGETFDSANASLRFEGTGVRLDAIDIRKGFGTVTGAAWVGWEGDYSFNADGRRIPVESLALASFPQAPLSGLLQFNASGAGTFDAPRYDVKVRVDDLFVRDEGIGQITGRIGLRDELLTLEADAASPRLVASGSGRIALTPEMDAELTLRFADTSFDPYLRFFEPSGLKISPFTTAVAGGTIRAIGELANVDHLVIDVCVDSLDLKLFDYRVRNKPLEQGESGCSIELALNRHVAEVTRLRLVGDGTELQLGGGVNLHERTFYLDASGDANLGIMQGFFRDIRSSGAAVLKAEIRGPLERPVLSGSATLKNGRIRHFSLPHSLESINGTLAFDPEGVRVVDATARLGGGNVRLGGRIGLEGFWPSTLALTATGEQMRIRYPEGFQSLIDADLTLTGSIRAPALGGRVTVLDALWTRRFETTPDLFNLSGGGTPPAPAAAAAPTTFPVRFDIEIRAASTLRVENNLARMWSSADLRLQGTYERPLLFGRAEIDRGDVVFEGNRYVITRGTIDFANPARIEPYFDIEAETRVRVPNQTYVVTLGFAGTAARMSMTLNSDPPLAELDIVALILGQTTDIENAELRMLNPATATQSEQELLRMLSGRLLTSPISAPVGRVVEQTLGIDTVQITPSFGTENDPLLSGARLIIGKRLSSRAYVTYARALGTNVRDQIIVLEYDQSDRLGFVITQNGDHTFAIDFRVRYRR